MSEKVSDVLNSRAQQKSSKDLILDSLKWYEDFPKKGVKFLDIQSVLQRSELLPHLIMPMIQKAKTATTVVSPESRGFIIGSIASASLGLGFIMARKPGKLPGKTSSINIDYEYNSTSLEVEDDSIQYLKTEFQDNPADVKKHHKVIIVDDVLATGGTVCGLITMLNSHEIEVVQVLTAFELTDLNGRKKLENLREELCLHYDIASGMQL